MGSFSNQISKYEDQLPKRKNLSISEMFQYIAGIASIFGLMLAPTLMPQEAKSLIYSTALIIIIAIVLIHAYIKERRKLHRYAQSTLYMHYINHLVRDCLAKMEDGNFSDTKIVLEKIVDAISNCYSLLTGKHCRCTIKELKDNLSVKTVVRDSISKNIVHICQQQDQKEHRLDDNTDFYNLWYSLCGCSRYFCCNDLINLYKINKYKNSSFNVVGDPEVMQLLNNTVLFVKKWTLPYKSTIVLPIRYFSEFRPPSETSEERSYSHWKFWGFLCIDCNSKKIFDSEFCPELGAAFSDILYIFLSQTGILLDKIGEKNI